MTTNTPLAAASVRPAIETKAAAAPAIGDPLASIAAKIDQSTATLASGQTKLADRITALEAKQSNEERRQRAFEALKQTNDDDERRPDPLNRETMRRQNQAIDEAERAELKALRARNRDLERKNARPRGGPALRPVDGRKAMAALLAEAQDHYLRFGEKTYKGHHINDLERKVYGVEAKAMHSGSNPDGGYLIQPEIDGTIEKLLTEVVPMRQIARVTNINAAEYHKYVRTSLGGAQWGTELSSGGQSGTPKYALLRTPAHNLYAEPRVTRGLVEDSGFDIVAEINEGCLEDFSLAEGIAFISGNGVEKPYGILGYATGDYVANASWEWGKIGFVATGASGAFPASSGGVGSADPLLTTPLALKAGYRQNAKWLGNRSTMGTCRTLKDGNGAYVWIMGDMTRGIPNTLAGHEFVEAEQMPDIAANSFSLAIADWEKAYRIVDRAGMSVLRDEYTAYPSIAFKCNKRVGGGIENFDAIKLVKFAA